MSAPKPVAARVSEPSRSLSVVEPPAVTVAPKGLLRQMFQDWSVNKTRPDARVVLVLFRFGQYAKRNWGLPGRITAIACQASSSIVFGVELPSASIIGPDLRLYHPHSIVVNPGVRMGSGCHLRHNTTLGNIVDRDGTERGNPVLGDGVDLGAGCAVLGPILIGDQARVGALAVVTKDVPAGGVVVGNPSRLIRVDPIDRAPRPPVPAQSARR